MATVQFLIKSKNQNGYLPFDGCRYRIVGEGGVLIYPKDNNIAVITKKNGLTDAVEIKDGTRFAIEVYDLVNSTPQKPRFVIPYKGVNNISRHRFYISGKEKNPIIVNVQQYYFQVQFKSSEKNWKPVAQGYYYSYRMVEKFNGLEKTLCVLKGFVNEQGMTDYISTEGAETVNKKIIKIEGGYDGLSALNRLNIEGNEGVFILVDLFPPNTSDEKIKKESKTRNSQLVNAIKPIPFGSSTRKFREVNINAAFDSTVLNGDQQVRKLQETYRPILLDIREKRGESYKLIRKDGQKLLNSGKNNVNSIIFNDGQTTQIYVPKNFKGILVLKDSKNAKKFEFNVGSVDSKNYSANEKPIDIAISQRTLDFESSGDFRHVDYTPNVCMIEMRKQTTPGVYNQERLLTCSSNDFHSIIWTLKEFIQLNRLLAPNIYALISSTPFDTLYLPAGWEISTNLRRRIIETILKPICFVTNALGKAIYSDLQFTVARMSGKSILTFPSGAGIRTYITTISLVTTGRKYYHQLRITDSSLKGSNTILFTIVMGLEVLEYISNPSNEKQITDMYVQMVTSALKFALAIKLTGFAMRILASGVRVASVTALTTIISSTGVVLVVGTVVAIIIGFGLQYLDDRQQLTVKIQDRFRKIDSAEVKMLKDFQPIFNQYGIFVKI